MPTLPEPTPSRSQPGRGASDAYARSVPWTDMYNRLALDGETPLDALLQDLGPLEIALYHRDPEILADIAEVAAEVGTTPARLAYEALRDHPILRAYRHGRRVGPRSDG